MRIAIEQAGEQVASRAGRILLGERQLELLGVIGHTPTTPDPRLQEVSDLEDYQTLVTDAADPLEMIEIALEASLNCAVTSANSELATNYHDKFVAAGRTLLFGATMRDGLAPSLPSHELTRHGAVLQVTVAATRKGTPLREGEAVQFPSPVGPQWATVEQDNPSRRTLTAPVSGTWAGALAKVTTAGDEGVESQMVGVSDLDVHLDALSLAAAAMVIDLYAPGAHSPAVGGDIYLQRLIDAGLDVATYSPVS